MALALFPGDVQSEGEKDKIIQHPENNAENAEKPKESTGDQQTPENAPEPRKEFNSIPFPSAPDPQVETELETKDDEDSLEFDSGHRKRVVVKPKGIYKKMNGGLVAAIAS